MFVLIIRGLFVSSILLQMSCQSENTLIKDKWHTIATRNHECSPLYRVKVPFNWDLHSSLNAHTFQDTTVPNCTYIIPSQEGEIVITIHTFPYTDRTQRIPSHLQINRWKKQFSVLDPLINTVESVSFNGFHGLFFEGAGQMEKGPHSMLAWSMQLAPLYEKKLSESPSLKRADFTIKALGSVQAIAAHKECIIQFAQSFELIEAFEMP